MLLMRDSDRDSGKASGMGCPDLPGLWIGVSEISRRVDDLFPTNIFLALQLGKIVLILHRLARDLLVVNL